MAGPHEPKKPAAPAAGRSSSPSVPAASPPRTTSGESASPDLALPAMPRYTGPDPGARFSLLGLGGGAAQTLGVAAVLTAPAPGGGVRGALPIRLDPGQPGIPKPAPAQGAAPAFDADQALARFHDRAYAVARVGPGVDLTDSMESTATGLAKATWKLPRPC